MTHSTDKPDAAIAHIGDATNDQLVIALAGQGERGGSNACWVSAGLPRGRSE